MIYLWPLFSLYLLYQSSLKKGIYKCDVIINSCDKDSISGFCKKKKKRFKSFSIT